MISPQLPEYSEKMISDHNLDFEILYDQNLSLSDTFNLTFQLSPELSDLYNSFGINLPQANGTEDWRLPMPARFVVNEDGEILDSQVNPDYTVRPEPTEILDLI